jgi:predicted amidohydrolase
MVRVAAYQSHAKSTLEARQKQIHEALSRADEERVDFICFPEGFLTGYYAEKELAKINSLEVSEDLFQQWLDAIGHYHYRL